MSGSNQDVSDPPRTFSRTVHVDTTPAYLNISGQLVSGGAALALASFSLDVRHSHWAGSKSVLRPERQRSPIQCGLYLLPLPETVVSHHVPPKPKLALGPCVWSLLPVSGRSLILLLFTE